MRKVSPKARSQLTNPKNFKEPLLAWHILSELSQSRTFFKEIVSFCLLTLPKVENGSLSELQNVPSPISVHPLLWWTQLLLADSFFLCVLVVSLFMFWLAWCAKRRLHLFGGNNNYFFEGVLLNHLTLRRLDQIRFELLIGCRIIIWLGSQMDLNISVSKIVEALFLFMINRLALNLVLKTKKLVQISISIYLFVEIPNQTNWAIWHIIFVISHDDLV